MTQTSGSDESEIILEPGDPGYVAPTEGETEPPPDPGPPPQDLRVAPELGGQYAIAVQRMHTTMVDSQNPADIVPNFPQITMSGITSQPPQNVRDAQKKVHEATLALDAAEKELDQAELEAASEPPTVLEGTAA